MGIIGMLVGGLAGKGIEAGADFAKQKLDERKAAKEARNAEIQGMVGKKIKLGDYNISKWWNTDGEMMTTVDRQMKDRNWRIQQVSNGKYCLLHAPSQTTIWVLVDDIV